MTDTLVKEDLNMEVITPTLTLDAIDAPAVNALAKLEEKDADAFRMEQLSEEEVQQVNDFADKIDFTDTNLIVSYGSGAQKRLADFSETALEHARTKDLDQVGNILSSLVADLKFKPTEKKGLAGLFGKSVSKVEQMKAHYAKVESNIDSVVATLEKHQETLAKDIAIEDRLFENNKAFFKEITMYIAAGKLALKKAREEELPKLSAKAQETGLAEDAQAVTDFSAMCERFEKKIYDLELTRNICLQNAPQIRLIQNNAILLSDKIQSTIMNTIPLWKNQMIIALGMAHSKEAIRAQQMVSDTTNQILKENAEMLHQTTVEIAEENERGIVDIETLQHTNDELIATIDDLIKVQAEGRAKRAAAEQELVNLEGQLKAKMMEISKVQA